MEAIDDGNVTTSVNGIAAVLPAIKVRAAGTISFGDGNESANSDTDFIFIFILFLHVFR